nr:tyrosine-protein kinase Fer [Crassostrea gigas]
MATDDTESNEYIKQSSYDETEIVNVVEEALLKLSTSNSHKNKKRGSAYENVGKKWDLGVEEQEWFHGLLPRVEAERLLIEDGDFLVRKSKDPDTNEPRFVLSTFFKRHVHFIFNNSDIDDDNSILEMVNQYCLSGRPWLDNSDMVLKNPIFREKWLLQNDDIILDRKLGKGYFGDVNKGIYKPMGNAVAVKTCNETFTQEQTKTLLTEGRILKQYAHPNIVRLIGIAAQRQPVLIVMEFVEGGDLLNHLKKQQKPFTSQQLINMCDDIASGMAYLESKNCVHKELAARNCLVGNGLVVKVSDFGLSRDKVVHTMSDKNKPIPWKWSAPEVLLNDTYTSLSDVNILRRKRTFLRYFYL